ncbi:MAG: hypothetical protein FJW23_00730 [Acidimicrobiia bacterium]|nr:hypothetical protein [Acidimicrobiia bacterium]
MSRPHCTSPTALAALFTLAIGLPAAPATAADLRVVQAAREGDLAAVRALVKSGAPVNERQGDGATALHWAAHWDDGEMVETLLDAGANVNAVNDLGVSPLWLACENGSPRTATRLLAAGANANVTLPSGETALMTASRTGNPDVVRALLAAGAAVNAREHSYHQTALMWAISQRHPEVVGMLVEAGADVHARSIVRHRRVNTEKGGFGREILTEVDLGGFTPILYAARHGVVESARLLVEAGANVNDLGAEGTSALLVATHSNHPEMALFLLDQGADPNLGTAGYTALHTAILHGQTGVVKALVARGADINAIVEQGTPTRRSSADHAITGYEVGATPIWLAARYRYPDIMRVLAAAGALPGRSELADGASLLHAAVQGSIPTIQPFEEDPSVGRAAMLEAVTVALDAGAAVDAVDKDGNTALHLAASRGQDQVVRLLVERGAAIDAKNGKGQTPLAMALSARGGNKTTAEVLRELGAAPVDTAKPEQAQP